MTTRELSLARPQIAVPRPLNSLSSRVQGAWRGLSGSGGGAGGFTFNRTSSVTPSSTQAVSGSAVGSEFTPRYAEGLVATHLVVNVPQSRPLTLHLSTDAGVLLSSVAVDAVAATWVAAELPEPVPLNFGTDYVAWFYNGDGSVNAYNVSAWVTDTLNPMSQLVIGRGGRSGVGDAFPGSTSLNSRGVVDVGYQVPVATIPPAAVPVITLVNGGLLSAAQEDERGTSYVPSANVDAVALRVYPRVAKKFRIKLWDVATGDLLAYVNPDTVAPANEWSAFAIPPVSLLSGQEVTVSVEGQNATYITNIGYAGYTFGDSVAPAVNPGRNGTIYTRPTTTSGRLTGLVDFMYVPS